jgi:hypothetical protein
MSLSSLLRKSHIAEEDLTVEALPYVVGRDAMTVLSFMEGTSQLCCHAPLERLVMPLECENLGVNSHPAYHGEGCYLHFLTSLFKLSHPALC